MEHGNRVHILLIEGHEHDGMAARVALSSDRGPFRFDVDSATGLREAKRRLGHVPYAAVVLDLEGRDMERLQEVLESTDRPVVVIAEERLGTAVAAMNLGAADVVCRTELAGRRLGRAVLYAVMRAGVERRRAAQDPLAKDGNGGLVP